MSRVGTVIVIKKDGTDGSKFPVLSQSCVFGRSAICDVRINLGSVSQEHCRLDIKEKGLASLSNISKQNQTLLNGKSVKTPVAIRHKDIITVANRQFRWEVANSNNANKPNLRGSHKLQKSPPSDLNAKRVTPVGIVTPTRRVSANVDNSTTGSAEKITKSSKRSLSFTTNNEKKDLVTSKDGILNNVKAESPKKSVKGAATRSLSTPSARYATNKKRKITDVNSVKIMAPSSPDTKKVAALRTIHANKIGKSKNKNKKLTISMNLWKRKKASVIRSNMVKQAVLRMPKLVPDFNPNVAVSHALSGEVKTVSPESSRAQRRSKGIPAADETLGVSEASPVKKFTRSSLNRDSFENSINSSSESLTHLLVSPLQTPAEKSMSLPLKRMVESASNSIRHNRRNLQKELQLTSPNVSSIKLLFESPLPKPFNTPLPISTNSSGKSRRKSSKMAVDNVTRSSPELFVGSVALRSPKASSPSYKLRLSSSSEKSPAQERSSVKTPVLEKSHKNAVLEESPKRMSSNTTKPLVSIRRSPRSSSSFKTDLGVVTVEAASKSPMTKSPNAATPKSNPRDKVTAVKYGIRHTALQSKKGKGTPAADYRNVKGLGRLFKSPYTPQVKAKKDTSITPDLRQLFKQPRRSPRANYDNVEGLSGLFSSPDMVLQQNVASTNLSDINEMFTTPSPSTSKSRSPPKSAMVNVTPRQLRSAKVATPLRTVLRSSKRKLVAMEDVETVEISPITEYAKKGKRGANIEVIESLSPVKPRRSRRAANAVPEISTATTKRSTRGSKMQKDDAQVAVPELPVEPTPKRGRKPNTHQEQSQDVPSDLIVEPSPKRGKRGSKELKEEIMEIDLPVEPTPRRGRRTTKAEVESLAEEKPKRGRYGKKSSEEVEVQLSPVQATPARSRRATRANKDGTDSESSPIRDSVMTTARKGTPARGRRVTRSNKDGTDSESSPITDSVTTTTRKGRSKNVEHSLLSPVVEEVATVKSKRGAQKGESPSKSSKVSAKPLAVRASSRNKKAV